MARMPLLAPKEQWSSAGPAGPVHVSVGEHAGHGGQVVRPAHAERPAVIPRANSEREVRAVKLITKKT